ncbi:MAG: hypothetical protein KC561_03175 [Myxococcales bacterium]|nr:hypothetical protein [Myxococcales bacterium]
MGGRDTRYVPLALLGGIFCIVAVLTRRWLVLAHPGLSVGVGLTDVCAEGFCGSMGQGNVDPVVIAYLTWGNATRYITFGLAGATFLSLFFPSSGRRPVGFILPVLWLLLGAAGIIAVRLFPGTGQFSPSWSFFAFTLGVLLSIFGTIPWKAPEDETPRMKKRRTVMPSGPQRLPGSQFGASPQRMPTAPTPSVATGQSGSFGVPVPLGSRAVDGELSVELDLEDLSVEALPEARPGEPIIMRNDQWVAGESLAAKEAAEVQEMELPQDPVVSPSEARLREIPFGLKELKLVAAGVVATLPNGTVRQLRWSGVLAVTVRRMPQTEGGYDELFVDLIRNYRDGLLPPPLRVVLGLTTVNFDALPYGRTSEAAENARRLVQFLSAKNPNTQLDRATQAFIDGSVDPLQFDDLDSWHSYNDRYSIY